MSSYNSLPCVCVPYTFLWYMCLSPWLFYNYLSFLADRLAFLQDLNSFLIMILIVVVYNAFISIPSKYYPVLLPDFCQTAIRQWKHAMNIFFIFTIGVNLYCCRVFMQSTFFPVAYTVIQLLSYLCFVYIFSNYVRVVLVVILHHVIRRELVSYF